MKLQTEKQTEKQTKTLGVNGPLDSVLIKGTCAHLYQWTAADPLLTCRVWQSLQYLHPFG